MEINTQTAKQFTEDRSSASLRPIVTDIKTPQPVRESQSVQTTQKTDLNDTTSLKQANAVTNTVVKNISGQDIADSNTNTDKQRQVNVSVEEAQQVVAQLRQQPQRVDRSLQFKVDESSGRTIITVKERSTGETLKQIPSEEIIQLGVRLKELAETLQGSNSDLKGLLLKKQV